MAYLTYDEYSELSLKPVTVEEFDVLLVSATNVLNGITRNFYKFNDIAADIEFRRESFKLALTAQIDYFYSLGAVSSDDITTVQSVSIGRTNISLGAGNGANFGGYSISNDALNFLYPTGLLYRGIKGCC